MEEVKSSISTSDLDEILDDSFLGLSFIYAKLYEQNGKNFINCFLKYQSIRSACAWIVQSYKHMGAFEECKASGKDFTGYCERLELESKWKRVLAEVLLILYSIIKT